MHSVKWIFTLLENYVFCAVLYFGRLWFSQMRRSLCVYYACLWVRSVKWAIMDISADVIVHLKISRAERVMTLLLTCFILTFSSFLVCFCKGMGFGSVQLDDSTCSMLPLSGAWSLSTPLLPLSGTQGLSAVPSRIMLWAAGSAWCVHFCSFLCFSVWKLAFPQVFS